MVSTDKHNELNTPSVHTEWYVSAMEQLVSIVQNLSQARDLESVTAIVRKAARSLTGADGATFVLRDGDKCYYADEDAISPLWKGQRFSMKICISGWVMLHAKPAIIEDIYKDPRIPAEAYRPTFVKSLTMVPIRTENPIGAIGNYWATNRLPTDEEVAILQTLANFTAIAMENVDLYTRLQEKLDALQKSNYELSSFSWAASHDLKSPLRAIDNLSLWIEEDIENGDRESAKKNLNTLRKRTRRMEKLLDSILEYAHAEHKLDPDNDEKANGKTLKDDILSLVYLPEGFSIEFSDSFDDILVPRMALQRILCNLINNAIIHHDKQHGIVKVSVKETDTEYVFKVKDDGPGIPPEYKERIFDMFKTLKPVDVTEGSGMGLAMVKKILSLYGGDITLETGPERGSTFRFTWSKSIEGFAENTEK